ncbi:NUDIX domain-containing protein [Bacillus thuringiensis]|uniref:NUDIX domain-containing protein n=1 Tax=Bacillus thuringiensis TaxID=1428 RepID=UPI0039876BB7
MFNEMSFSIDALTSNQPFCAGVILVKDKKVVTTLNSDGLPDGNQQLYRVGAVGGGQEPGEIVTDCALREAREETGAVYDLLNSPITYLYDMDNKKFKKIKCEDKIAPFFIEFKRNPKPYKPYKNGLPIGPYTYFVMYIASSLTEDIYPSDDVEGLLVCPISQWGKLEKEITLTQAISLGCNLIERHTDPIDKNKKIWMDPDESMRKVARLLEKHSDLMNFNFSSNVDIFKF